MVWKRVVRKLKVGWGEGVPDWAQGITHLLVIADVILAVVWMGQVILFGG
jgi:hypothetical protein